MAEKALELKSHHAQLVVTDPVCHSYYHRIQYNLVLACLMSAMIALACFVSSWLGPLLIILNIVTLSLVTRRIFGDIHHLAVRLFMAGQIQPASFTMENPHD